MRDMHTGDQKGDLGRIQWPMYGAAGEVSKMSQPHLERGDNINQNRDVEIKWGKTVNYLPEAFRPTSRQTYQ